MRQNALQFAAAPGQETNHVETVRSGAHGVRNEENSRRRVEEDFEGHG